MNISPAKKKLLDQYKRLQKEDKDVAGVKAAPSPDNIMEWNAIISGPPDTIWEGGVFKMKLEFTEDYPQTAPIVKFVTPIFHPNVYGNGKICVDTLQKEWSPYYTIAALLQCIRSLLNEPNPDSPANIEASDMYKAYIKAKEEGVENNEYVKKVRACVEESIRLNQI
ncbi:ubiquitin-conjugating enzyme E2 2 [Histomonas meleagridis]|uniref:ubiquitin-conjugating enzyme E2 2 n=1 Tax=Histomonas meleagridis TaxID=135588 RepID=UPI003559FB98|nr:ubiquitin-conjugating enzyme E2 2 [Histomonas meleagridis]KAH0806334.1 ubiquitin-conjugating enzyme E2 2 [Histomonas meleagridis]